MFLASNPTKCKGSRVPGTGTIFLFILIIFSAPGFLLSMYLNILLLNSGIAALGGYLPHSLKLTDNSCLTKSGIFRVGSPNDIFNIG